MVDAAIGEHLEVLRRPLRGRVGIRFVEGVRHADAFDRILFDTVDGVRRLYPRGFKDRRYNVDHVMELMMDAAWVVDVAGPRDNHSLTGAAEVRGDLLHPLERSVKGPGPRHRHVRVSFVGAP